APRRSPSPSAPCAARPRRRARRACSTRSGRRLHAARPMTLRVRLAIALALLAAVSVVAVAAIGYTATDQRLHDEVDASLVRSARQLGDPRPAAARCPERARGAFLP